MHSFLIQVLQKAYMPKTDPEHVENHMEKNMQMKWKRGLCFVVLQAYSNFVQGFAGKGSGLGRYLVCDLTIKALEKNLTLNPINPNPTP